MARLFIIGNGFDLHHGLKTSYLDFRHFLLEQKGRLCESDLVRYRHKFQFAIPELTHTPGGKLRFDPRELAAFYIIAVEDYAGSDRNIDPWNAFESRLGEIDLHLQQTYSAGCFGQDWRQAGQEDFWDNCIQTFAPLNTFFEEWVSQIDLSAARADPCFLALIDPDKDLFFTFNYTETLETLYNARQVLHIHGRRGKEVVFGHGKSFPERPFGYPDVEKESFFNSLRKYTSLYLRAYRSFFDSLQGQVEAIYSSGFSFSEVDLPYISRILSSIDTRGMVWYLDATYDDPAVREEYQRRVEGLLDASGRPLFQGTFSTFHLSDRQDLDSAWSWKQHSDSIPIGAEAPEWQPPKDQTDCAEQIRIDQGAQSSG